MGWQSVNSEEDLIFLGQRFGGFHDACLREIHVSTNHYVTDTLQMNVVGDLDTSASLLFQRQFRDPSAIEMRFSELTRLVLAPTADNYDSIIFRAQLKLTEQGHFMLHVEKGVPSPVTGAKSELLVAGRQLAWREVDLMGSDLRYGHAIESTRLD